MARSFSNLSPFLFSHNSSGCLEYRIAAPPMASVTEIDFFHPFLEWVSACVTSSEDVMSSSPLVS